MECNDPWTVNSDNIVLGNALVDDKFEDNFIASHTSPSPNSKLPDSAEYLASLEKKLAKIKNGKGKNSKTEGKDLIKSLEETSDSCMYRLIAGDSYTLSEQDLALEAPTELSLSSKWLKPEQAITVGELVELVKADYLANQVEDSCEEKHQGLKKTSE